MTRKSRRERREAGRGGRPTRYQMRQKLVAFGDDFYIEDDQGQKRFKVDGKVLRVRDTLIFRDMQGEELSRIKERLLRVKDTMEIEGPGGKTAAMIKKNLITPLRDRWTIDVKGGPDLDVKGNILDHEYQIEEGRHKVAGVSKKWLHVRDTYGVEIEPGQNDILILTATVAIDMMAHDGN